MTIVVTMPNNYDVRMNTDRLPDLIALIETVRAIHLVTPQPLVTGDDGAVEDADSHRLVLAA